MSLFQKDFIAPFVFGFAIAAALVVASMKPVPSHAAAHSLLPTFQGADATAR